MSKRASENWKDADYVRRIIAIRNLKPNKLEKQVESTLEKLFPGEWKYNGDFSCGITIGGKIPDFVNINGKKAVIEVFGDVWHDKKKSFGKQIPGHRTEFGCKAVYQKFGYDCVIVWESELKHSDPDQIILEKLAEIKGR